MLQPQKRGEQAPWVFPVFFEAIFLMQSCIFQLSFKKIKSCSLCKQRIFPLTPESVHKALKVKKKGP